MTGLTLPVAITSASVVPSPMTPAVPAAQPGRHLLPPRLARLADDDRAKLDALGVPVVTGKVVRLRHHDGVLQAVVLADGQEHQMQALAVAPRFVARPASTSSSAGR